MRAGEHDHEEVTMITVPACDVCRACGIDTAAVIDAKTIHGPWAYMCEGHWRTMGATYPRLGEGKGQRLVTSPNVAFAARSLNEHAENVVQRARADIEAMVLSKATQLGLDPADLGTVPQLETGDDS